MNLTSSELDCGIFCATDLPSDSQYHVFYCACVCVSILASSGQKKWLTLCLLVKVHRSMLGMIGVLSKHTHLNNITLIGCVSNRN
jgi:hypothetical protein